MPYYQIVFFLSCGLHKMNSVAFRLGVLKLGLSRTQSGELSFPEGLKKLSTKPHDVGNLFRDRLLIIKGFGAVEANCLG